MKIEFVEIQNFRKLKSCRIDFSDKETIFVGANNSGKTSAMDILIQFLKNRQNKVTTTDITLSNWRKINLIGKKWKICDKPEELNLDIAQWRSMLPVLDIWLNVNNDEIHYVSHLIPTLSWTGGRLGVRLCFEPKNVEKLYKEFKEESDFAVETVSENNKNSNNAKLSLWPKTMKHFLEKRSNYFNIKSYLLDPGKLVDAKNGEAYPQNLSKDSVPLDSADPFKGLFKIDVINAQRGFSDANIPDDSGSVHSANSLTAQLRCYFDKHLNPAEQPDKDDIEALAAIENANNKFDEKLKSSFSAAISELEGLGYPGFTDPKIILTSKVNPIDSLKHDSAVRFNVPNSNEVDGTESLSLPEKYNGLGYQNLISMVFKLIYFRDEWMREGIASKRHDDDSAIEPLHLVFIEEPEAHLHAQVQQVFIRKAFNVLRNHKLLNDSQKFSTQMVVSTHSSHIAHEIDFSCLRYFRRQHNDNNNSMPCATIVNLSQTFGKEDATSKFVTRYLKIAHCDLFFADAVILVEGVAERMLVPYFIRENYEILNSRYITILEIGGSHAHRLRPLIDDLRLLTLIVTDIDSIQKDSTKKIQPARGKSYRTGNDTLKGWLPNKDNLDDWLNLPDNKKISKNSLVRIAYQYPFKVIFNEKEKEAIPYTFEDAFALSNIDLFRSFDNPTGLLRNMSAALLESTLPKVTAAMFQALDKGKKAEMALELLFRLDESKKLLPPKYIAEGLEWLQDNLKNNGSDSLNKENLAADK